MRCVFSGKVVDVLSRRLSGQHKVQRISSSYKGLEKLKRLEGSLANSKHDKLKVILYTILFYLVICFGHLKPYFRKSGSNFMLCGTI